MDGTLEALREAELRYRMTADFTYDWEYWESPDGTLRYVSPSCQRITGYAAEQFIQDPHLLEELILPQDREVWASHRHAAEAGVHGEAQFRIQRRDGGMRWIEHVCQPVTDERGRFLGYRASNRDITERKQVEEELWQYRGQLEELVAERTAELAEANTALRAEIAERKRAEEARRQSQERYALAQRAANVGSWDWDIESGDLHWSEEIALMFGVRLAGFDATYEMFLDCVHPEDRQRVIDAIDDCIEGGRDYAIDHRVVWPDGTVRWVSETGNAIRNQNGEAVRMLGVVRDITGRRQAEKALRESEEKFRNVAEQSPNMIFINQRGKVVYANRRCEELLGYTREELCSSDFDFLTLVSPEYVSLVKANFSKHMSGQDVPPYEYALITRDGVRIQASVAPKLIRYEGDRAVLGTVTDITERKLAEEAQRVQSRELEARISGLNCLYGISHLVERPGVSLEEILQGTADLIPPAWRHPQIACARIVLDGQEFKTKNFSETSWQLAQDIAVFGERAGTVQVGYLPGVLESKKEPFLPEEVDLLRAIGQRLGRIVERMRAEESLREAKEAAELARGREQERRWEAERRGQIAESLGGVLAALNSNQALAEVLDLIAVQARQLLGTRAVGIYGLEDEAGTLAIQAAHGLLIAYVAGTNIPIGQGALRQAMISRQPVPVPDVAAALANGGDLVLDAQRRDRVGYWVNVYQALLAVPILVQEQVYGGMLLYYGQPRSFSDEDLDLAVLFGEQAALAVENARLREQVERTAATAERGRLARELHDAVTQTLFSASLIAEALPRVWEQHPEEGLRGLEELRQLTRGASAEMRTLLLELRPAALMEKPLGELLRHLTDAMTSRTRVPMALTIEGDSSLPPNQQIALYRIAQEALNNVAKHAQASEVRVYLCCLPGEVTLSVSDNGLGFDPSGGQRGNFGMGIMRERAEGIGATLDVKSEPGHGTQIMVAWHNRRE